MLSGGFQGVRSTSGYRSRGAAPGGYAVVDVEATGSSSRRHRIVELAVVLLDGERRPEGEFSTLVDPEGPVGPTHIHGIEPHDLLPAPRFAEIAPRLLGLLSGRVLVGHNVGCDRAFLTAEYARIGVALPAVPELCTMRLAERYLPAARGLSLRACAQAAGLPGWPAHTALGDARASGQLLARCAPDAPAVEAVLAAAAQVRWPRLPQTPGRQAVWIARPARTGARRAYAPGDAPRRMTAYARNGGA